MLRASADQPAESPNLASSSARSVRGPRSTVETESSAAVHLACTIVVIVVPSALAVTAFLGATEFEHLRPELAEAHDLLDEITLERTPGPLESTMP